MHRYSVKYLSRDGYPTSRVIYAKNSRAARRIAEEAGCNDILGVRRAGFNPVPIVMILIVLVGVVIGVYVKCD